MGVANVQVPFEAVQKEAQEDEEEEEEEEDEAPEAPGGAEQDSVEGLDLSRAYESRAIKVSLQKFFEEATPCPVCYSIPFRFVNPSDSGNQTAGLGSLPFLGSPQDEVKAIEAEMKEMREDGVPVGKHAQAWNWTHPSKTKCNTRISVDETLLVVGRTG